MWQPEQYRRVIKASAWYDLIVTAAFATPWSFAVLHDFLSALSQTWNLPGALPPFESMHMLMANLLGSIVCVWAVLRIRDPQQIFGRYDGVGRLLFSTWQVYALMHGASFLLLGFLLMELFWALLQLWPVRAESGLDKNSLHGVHAIEQKMNS